MELEEVLIGGSSEWKSSIGEKEAKGKFYILKRAPEKGFYMDMLVMIPDKLDEKTRIAMTTRNSGSPGGSVWRPKSFEESEKDSSFEKEPFYKDSYDELTDEDFKKFYPRSKGGIEEIYSQLLETNNILVYPMVFQRAGAPYFQHLTRDALTYDKEDCFKRVDNQIMNAIDNLREILRADGIETEDNIDLLGQSAAGSFAQCFCMLHSDRVNSLCTNGAKDATPLPIETYQKGNSNALLRYPYGIGDIKDFTGMEPKQVASNLKKIPFLNTYGVWEDLQSWKRSENNHSGPPISEYETLSILYPPEHADAIRKLFGDTQNKRVLAYEDIYSKSKVPHLFVGFDASLKVNPKSGDVERLEYGHGQMEATYKLANQFVKSVNNPEKRENPAEIISGLQEYLKGEHESSNKTSFWDIGQINKSRSTKDLFLRFEKCLGALREKDLEIRNNKDDSEKKASDIAQWDNWKEQTQNDVAKRLRR